MSELLKAIEFVKHAAGKSDVRYYLNGIHVKQGNGVLQLTATDGHRLARAALRGPDYETPIDRIITNEGVKLALTLLKSNLPFDLNTLPEHTGHAYPDADRVIPRETAATETLSINAKYLAEACAAAAKLAPLGIKLEMNGPSSMIVGRVGDDAMFLIMPVKL